MMDTPRKQGFTLAEALIGSALMVIVIGGAYMLVSRTQALIYSARNHYVAVNISRARLERARDFAYTQLISLTESNVVVNDSGVPTSDGYFRRTTMVTTNYQAGLTKIEVRTDIRNTRTLEFTGDSESLATLSTEYLTQ